MREHAQGLADNLCIHFFWLYLCGLQARSKMQSSSAELWLMGCITKVHPSPDGHARLADVRVKDRTYMTLVPAVPAEDGGHPHLLLRDVAF